MMQLVNLVCTLVWLAGAGVMAVFVYNQVVYRLEHLRSKLPLVTAMALAGAAAALVVGPCTGMSVWLVIPVGILAAAAWVEWRRERVRRTFRGPPPVEARNDRVRLLGPLTTFDLAVRRYEVRDERIGDARLRVVHLSDLHVNGFTPRGYLESVGREVRSLEPDLVFLTGDFIGRARHVRLLRGRLDWLSTARLGAFGILGNHDHWEAPEALTAVLREAGVEMLGNAARRVATGGGEVDIMGCEDPWGPERWQPEGEPGQRPVLALTHAADNFHRLRTVSPLAIFAGHYHGGQADLPLFGPVMISSSFGRHFRQGHFTMEGIHLFVSAGIGVAFPPVRLWCKPEILVVDFVGGRTGGEER